MTLQELAERDDIPFLSNEEVVDTKYRIVEIARSKWGGHRWVPIVGALYFRLTFAAVIASITVVAIVLVACLSLALQMCFFHFNGDLIRSATPQPWVTQAAEQIRSAWLWLPFGLRVATIIAFAPIALGVLWTFVGGIPPWLDNSLAQGIWESRRLEGYDIASMPGYAEVIVKKAAGMPWAYGDLYVEYIGTSTRFVFVRTPRTIFRWRAERLYLTNWEWEPESAPVQIEPSAS